MTCALFRLHLGKAVNLLGNIIGIWIVIAITGSFAQHFADWLIARKIGFTSVNHFLAGKFFISKNQFFDSSKRIHKGREALRRMARQSAAGVVYLQHAAAEKPYAQQIEMLLLIDVVKFIPTLELQGIASFNANQLIAIVLHSAIIEGHFQSGRKIHIDAARIAGIAVEQARFRAAGDGVVQSLIYGRCLDSVEHHHIFVVDELGKTRAIFDS